VLAVEVLVCCAEVPELDEPLELELLEPEELELPELLEPPVLVPAA
jgi:hypothetical protein